MNMGDRLSKLNSTGEKTFGDKLFFTKHNDKTIHQIIYEENDPEYILWLEKEKKAEFTNEVLMSAEYVVNEKNENNDAAKTNTGLQSWRTI